MGIQSSPISSLKIRFSGAYSKHEFVEYIEIGVKLNGSEINSAPRFVGNAEITYRPSFAKGLRILTEWQGMSRYFMDQANAFSYNGFNVVNFRTGYTLSHVKNKWLKGTDIWLNVINLFDAYYAVNSSRSSAGRSYTLGEPRNINLGFSYDFGSLYANK